jgi:hypothetical protein
MAETQMAGMELPGEFGSCYPIFLSEGNGAWSRSGGPAFWDAGGAACLSGIWQAASIQLHAAWMSGKWGEYCGHAALVTACAWKCYKPERCLTVHSFGGFLSMAHPLHIQ